MGDFLKRSLKSRGVRDIFLVSTGRIVASGLGFLANIILARELGPEAFGLFTLALTIMIVIAGITGGSVDQAIVKLSSAYLREGREKAELVFKTAFKIKMLVGLFLLLTGFLLSAPLSRVVFKQPGLENLVRLSFLGAIGITLLGYVLSFVQAHQTFGKHVLLEVSNSFLKLIAVGLLLYVGWLNPVNSMAIYAAIPFLTFLLGMAIIPKKCLWDRGSHESVLPEIVNFSKWIVLSYVIFAIHRRMDIFLLNYFEEIDRVGIYSVAFIPASILDLASMSLFVVVLPRVSRFTMKSEYVNFIKKFLAGAIPLYALICIVSWWISKPFIITFYTVEFMDSVRILKILVPGYGFCIVAVPLSAILLSRNKLKLLVAIDFSALLVMLVVSILLIPKYGAEGTAVAVLISNAVFMVLIISYVIKDVRKISDESGTGTVEATIS